MLGQLFSVVTAGTPLQNETAVTQHQPEIRNSAGQLIPHRRYETVHFFGFHVAPQATPIRGDSGQSWTPLRVRQPSCQGRAFGVSLLVSWGVVANVGAISLRIRRGKKDSPLTYSPVCHPRRTSSL